VCVCVYIYTWRPMLAFWYLSRSWRRCWSFCSLSSSTSRSLRHILKSQCPGTFPTYSHIYLCLYIYVSMIYRYLCIMYLFIYICQSKETEIYGKRDLLSYLKRPTIISMYLCIYLSIYVSALVHFQYKVTGEGEEKRPTIISKETYYPPGTFPIQSHRGRRASRK
jgi:hypothetical protein